MSLVTNIGVAFVCINVEQEKICAILVKSLKNLIKIKTLYLVQGFDKSRKIGLLSREYYLFLIKGPSVSTGKTCVNPNKSLQTSYPTGSFLEP